MAEKQLVFLLHGMGNYDEGWSKDTQTLLTNLYRSYKMLEMVQPIDDTLEFVELNYNHFFDDLRNQWASSAKDVIGQIKKTSTDNKNGSGALNGLSKADHSTFLRTHLLDVVLYRFFPILNKAIQAHVGKTISDHLMANPGVKWSIVAHSLGTAVAHDTLHSIFSSKGPKPLPMSAFGANVVAMIANVSRLLELKDQNGNDWDVFRSVVRPSRDPRKGCCQYYINAWHALDPFIWPSKVSPNNDWPDPSNTRRLSDVKTTEILDRNVHGLDHYLTNPLLHIELFQRLTFRTLISEEEKETAIERYQSQQKLAVVEKRIIELKKLTVDPNLEDWKEILKNWLEYR